MFIAETVFLFTLLATFGASWLGRRHAAQTHEGVTDGLAAENLNKWLIGLSAGTTANSGVIVTGIVGLAYTGGVKWLLLGPAWLLGDLVFWFIFPARLNRLGRATQATTLGHLLTHGLTGRAVPLIGLLAALIVLLCLGGYISAQWLAGQKFLHGAFNLPDTVALGLFGLLIIAYSSLGGFKGSVYTDTLQAVIRLLGTALAVIAVVWVAHQTPAFHANLAAAGPDFLNPLAGATLVSLLGFFLGWACVALGFDLGQPQIVSRFIAGKSPEETRSARWIYLGFVQLTWLPMTVFGVVLRGVMPGLPDPETGLSVFFTSHMGALLTGLIVADVFATIAATSNGVLVALAQTLQHDLLARLPGRLGQRARRLPLAAATLLLGALTLGLSTLLDSSVFAVALSSVALIGASLGAAVLIRCAGWRHTAGSLLTAMVVGFGSALLWKIFGDPAALNEAAIGMPLALAGHFAVNRLTRAS